LSIDSEERLARKIGYLEYDGMWYAHEGAEKEKDGIKHAFL
jgi:hypothetical protein